MWLGVLPLFFSKCSLSIWWRDLTSERGWGKLAFLFSLYLSLSAIYIPFSEFPGTTYVFSATLGICPSTDSHPRGKTALWPLRLTFLSWWLSCLVFKPKEGCPFPRLWGVLEAGGIQASPIWWAGPLSSWQELPAGGLHQPLGHVQILEVANASAVSTLSWVAGSQSPGLLQSLLSCISHVIRLQNGQGKVFLPRFKIRSYSLVIFHLPTS